MTEKSSGSASKSIQLQHPASLD